MKLLFYFIFIALACFLHASSQHPFFDLVDRTAVVTQFNGSLLYGNSLYIYGDNGVIIRSDDAAATWSRIDIDDTLNVVGMAAKSGNIIALSSHNCAFISSDKGNHWQKIQLSDNTYFSQLIAQNDTLYALGNHKILMLSDNLAIFREVELPFTSNALAFSTLENNIIATQNQDGKIFLYDGKTTVWDSVNIADFIPNYSDTKLLAPLMSDGISALYLVYNTNLYAYNTVKQRGKFLAAFRKQGVSTFFNRNIYNIFPETAVDKNTEIFVHKYSLDNGSLADIKASGSDCYLSDIFVKNLNFLTKDIVLAVGWFHLIYMSTNGGAQWTTISLYSGINGVFAFNDRQIRCINEFGKISRTDDYGATWPPQKTYRQDYKNSGFSLSANKTYIFKDTSQGFIYRPPYHIADTNTIITHDCGETSKFIYFDKPSGNSTNWSSYATSYENDYIFVSQGYLPVFGYWTVIHRLNDTLGIVHKTSYKDISMFYITNFNKTLYALAIDRKENDSTCWVYSSTDGGAEWNKIFSFVLPNTASIFSFESPNVSRVGRLLIASWMYTMKYPDGSSEYLQSYFRIDLEAKTASEILKAKVSIALPVCNVGNRFFATMYSYVSGQGLNVKREMLYTDDIAANPVV